MNIKLEEIIKEASRCLNCKTKPCVQACPMNNDIPTFINLIKQNDLQKAADALSQTTNLASICSLVCQKEKQCEGSCTRGIKGQPVKISMLENYLSNYIKLLAPKDFLNYSVAIIGSGPSGISCAKELYKLGIKATIFEKRSASGGVLTYGIPEFRLPYATVLKEITDLTNLGIKINNNIEIGKDLSFNDLYKKYDAIYIANGVDKSNDLPLKKHPNVFYGLDFLELYNQTKIDASYIMPNLNVNSICIIGGGNVAIDCARVALRMGITNVNICYRRSEDEMPASYKEYEQSISEGVVFHFLTNPIEIIIENETIIGLKCLKMSLGALDASNRPKPIEIENSDFIIPTDAIVMAIGNTGNLDFVQDYVKQNKNSLICVNEQYQTSDPKIYAGGDITAGAATVANANKAGKMAALSIYNDLTKK